MSLLSNNDGGHLTYERVMIEISKEYMTERIMGMEKKGWEYISSELNIFDNNYVNMTFIRIPKKKKERKRKRRGV